MNETFEKNRDNSHKDSLYVLYVFRFACFRFDLMKTKKIQKNKTKDR